MTSTHDHNHDHPHHHDHDSEAAGEMSFRQKLEKLLAHWIKHNKDHSGSYRQWAEKAKSEDMEAVGEMLDDIAQTSDKINTKLERALAQIEADKA